jgi:hypothetical protein
MLFTPTAYYITNIVTATLPPGTLPEGSLTKVIASQCGLTLGSIYDKIEAIPVYLATQYEFNITDGNSTIVIPSDTNSFFLSKFPGGGVLNTEYTITVRSKGASTAFTAYGDPCTVTTPASAPTPLAIGDSALGGKVAYILISGDPGYNSSIQHGLIATTSDFPTTAAWGCEGTFIPNTETGIGTGNANTIRIMAGCPTAGIAARLCGDLIEGGYSDWYLPSKDELNQLYINRVAIGGFSTAGYWSSTQDTSNLAWYQSFGSGNQTDGDKSVDRSVRPIRSF